MQKWTRAQGKWRRLKRVQLGAQRLHPQMGGWGSSWCTPLACGARPMWMFTCHGGARWAGGLKEVAMRMGQTLPSSAAWPGSCPLGGRVPTGEGSQALCLLSLVPCPDPQAALPLPALPPHPPMAEGFLTPPGSQHKVEFSISSLSGASKPIVVPSLCSGPAEGLGSCWSQADPRIEERPLGALAAHLGFCALGFGGCAWEGPSPALPRAMSLSAPWTCLPWTPLGFQRHGLVPNLENLLPWLPFAPCPRGGVQVSP